MNSIIPYKGKELEECSSTEEILNKANQDEKAAAKALKTHLNNTTNKVWKYKKAKSKYSRNDYKFWYVEDETKHTYLVEMKERTFHHQQYKTTILNTKKYNWLMGQITQGQVEGCYVVVSFTDGVRLLIDIEKSPVVGSFTCTAHSQINRGKQITNNTEFRIDSLEAI